ncbi:MAG: hypothetical protein KGI50_05970 [Patescibacteria group bacterium]|nr:hypothetical protein [Patescibacteria group bacterium]
MSELNEAVELPVTPTDEQVQQSEEIDHIEGDGQEVKPEETAKPESKKDWIQRRIDKLTAEKHEERRQREAIEFKLNQYRQAQPIEGEDMRTAVQRQAEQIVKQRDFDKACNNVFEAGVKDFPNFAETLQTFQLLGGAPADFLETVTSLDGGHKVLHHLGQDPELAERVLSMSPKQQAIELARLETKLSQTTPKPVSRVPDPIKPIAGAGRSSQSGLSDDLPIDEWMKRNAAKR